MERRPSDSIYALVGRWIMRLVVNRYRTQIRGAAVFAVVSLAIGAYLATRPGSDED